MASRLNLIRNAMKQINIQAYIIPSSDAHMVPFYNFSLFQNLIK